MSESQRRLYEKLYRDLGEINEWLKQEDVNEVMANPDGTLWIDSQTQGQIQVGTLHPLKTQSILNAVAGLHGFVVAEHKPILEAELPFYESMRGERFTGQIPPIVPSPSFTIRKRAQQVYRLEDYVQSRRMSFAQAEFLKSAVRSRKNILISGGPGSGKTTVTNALIQEASLSDTQQRFLILEDLPELQCQAPNHVSMLTSQYISMTQLLKAAMRMRPDRILVGEVRGAEALDLLKAWNTGCPGGISTVHANSASEAIQRILDLSLEAGLIHPPISLVTHTIDILVSVGRLGPEKGFIQDILSVGDYINGAFQFKKVA